MNVQAKLIASQPVCHPINNSASESASQPARVKVLPAEQVLRQMLQRSRRSRRSSDVMVAAGVVEATVPHRPQYPL